MRSVAEGQCTVGHARPVRHYGSVDVFIEALLDANPGDVLVIDNGGRLDEGCIGDLIVLECRLAGLAAIVVWGAHRDTSEIRQIELPVFSYNAYPAGPLRLDRRETEALESAYFGDHLVTGNDVVFADVDGVVFVPAQHVTEIILFAQKIAKGEQEQSKAMQLGQNLRQQFRFQEYLQQRQIDPAYTFRAHLQQIGGNIEE
ncbi:MAG: RraA family protein [Chloroflexi bacterium]|nr:RraA family protein [Chloroflexota bacterium]